MKDLQGIIDQIQLLMPEGEVEKAPEAIEAAITSNPLDLPSKPPGCILKPASPGELQEVMQFANKSGLNLTVTSSTGAHRHGGILNNEEHLLVDLSSWNQIDLIDRRNRVCRVQPGVTYGQLLTELSDHHMTLPTPLAPRNGKSVLASVMDREPHTWPNKQWDSSDPVGSTEFFFGTGERFRSGAGGGPGTIDQQREAGGAQKLSSGPSQTDFHRVVQGAEGALGIVTWITLRCELEPSIQETRITGSHDLEDLLDFVYAVQRRMIGEQSFILNNTAAAMLMAGDNQGAYDHLREETPGYLLLQNVAGFERLPSERLAYHLDEIRDHARGSGLQLFEQVGGISAAELLTRATQPCGNLDWRDRLLGKSLSVIFISTLDRMPRFEQLFNTIAREHGIAESRIGIYIQPIVQNHACHFEGIIPFDAKSESELLQVKVFEKQIVAKLIEEGAYFSRPYGSATQLVWNQNPANYTLLKQVKQIFDPNRILQRGKWNL